MKIEKTCANCWLGNTKAYLEEKRPKKMKLELEG